jgi:hypothetical protein
MNEAREYKERLRRWGWVSVAIGLPGAALLGYEGYIMYVDYHEPSMAEVFMVFALLAPLVVGVRMIMSGYRSEHGDGSAERASPREEEPSVPQSAPRHPVIRPTCSTREKAYEAAMKSDLKNLASQQEIYFSDYYAYSSSFEELAFTNIDGVTVHVVATTSGWTANAWHAALGQNVGCAMFYGDVDFVLRTGGGRVPTEPGEYVCDDV